MKTCPAYRFSGQLGVQFGGRLEGAEGFGAVGWIMPFVAILAGLAVVPFVIHRWRQNQLAAEAAAPEPVAVDEEVLNRFKAQIDRDLAAEE